MNNKTVSTKINTLFLVFVLATGTIAAISPSFIVGEVQAQQDYGGINNRFNNYEIEPEYLPQDKDKKYSSYEPTYEMNNNNYQKSYEDRYGPTEYSDNNYYNIYESDYGMDNDNRKSYKTNSYEPTTTSYGNDNNYQKAFENDNSYDKSQYQFYKPDYKPAYPSYGKDKSSKDSNKSVSINKLKEYVYY